MAHVDEQAEVYGELRRRGLSSEECSRAKSKVNDLIQDLNRIRWK